MPMTCDIKSNHKTRLENYSFSTNLLRKLLFTIANQRHMTCVKFFIGFIKIGIRLTNSGLIGWVELGEV